MVYIRLTKTTCFGHKFRNCVSMVRSHHPLRVGLIFYETEGGICRWLGAARIWNSGVNVHWIAVNMLSELTLWSMVPSEKLIMFQLAIPRECHSFYRIWTFISFSQKPSLKPSYIQGQLNLVHNSHNSFFKSAVFAIYPPPPRQLHLDLPSDI